MVIYERRSHVENIGFVSVHMYCTVDRYVVNDVNLD